MWCKLYTSYLSLKALLIPVRWNLKTQQKHQQQYNVNSKFFVPLLQGKSKGKAASHRKLELKRITITTTTTSTTLSFKLVCVCVCFVLRLEKKSKSTHFVWVFYFFPSVSVLKESVSNSHLIPVKWNWKTRQE